MGTRGLREQGVEREPSEQSQGEDVSKGFPTRIPLTPALLRYSQNWVDTESPCLFLRDSTTQ